MSTLYEFRICKLCKVWGYAYIWKHRDVWSFANGNYTHIKVTKFVVVCYYFLVASCSDESV